MVWDSFGLGYVGVFFLGGSAVIKYCIGSITLTSRSFLDVVKLSRAPSSIPLLLMHYLPFDRSSSYIISIVYL